MLRCFPKVACFLLCKCRGADVTDIVQPLFLKPIQQLQDFDEGFHEFRCEFCGREDTSADALVEGLCFLHTFKTCLIFSSTPNTPLSRIVHVTGKNLSIGGAHVSKIAIVWAGSQLHFTRAGHTLLARMSNAISLSVL